MKKEVNNIYQCPLCGAIGGLSFYSKDDEKSMFEMPSFAIFHSRIRSVSFSCDNCGTLMEISTPNLSGLESLFKQTHANETK